MIITKFRFALEIDDINQDGYTEVIGFDVSTDLIDYREGNEETRVRIYRV